MQVRENCFGGAAAAAAAAQISLGNNSMSFLQIRGV